MAARAAHEGRAEHSGVRRQACAHLAIPSDHITIWHVDPEKDGSDDSCDWFHRRLTKREKEFAASLIDNKEDNLRNFFAQWIPATCEKHSVREDCYDAGCHLGDHAEICTTEEMTSRVMNIFRCYKREFHWHYPVRWHFWHWKLQIHPLQQFKRWAFSRCEKCGRHFAFGESPISGSWDSDGPRWFRSEKNIWHSSCDAAQPCQPQQAVKSA